MRGSTRRETTAAQLRGAWTGRAIGANTVAKCANCGGPHFGQAKACPKKKAARSEAKG